MNTCCMRGADGIACIVNRMMMREYAHHGSRSRAEGPTKWHLLPTNVSGRLAVGVRRRDRRIPARGAAEVVPGHGLDRCPEGRGERRCADKTGTGGRSDGPRLSPPSSCARTDLVRDGARGRFQSRLCSPHCVDRDRPGTAERDWPARLSVPSHQRRGAGGLRARQGAGSTG